MAKQPWMFQASCESLGFNIQGCSHRYEILIMKHVNSVSISQLS